MNNNSEQIGRYLQNEMSAGERNAFEKQLESDKDLQQELSIQKQIIAAVDSAGLKNTFGKAIRRKFIARQLIRWGIVAVIITGLVFYALKTNMFSALESDSNVKLENVERFVINNTADTIIETEDGVVFAIPAHAFNSKGDIVHLEIKTAIDPYDIMRQGLSTTSNGSLLQTAGMFYINAYENDKPLSLIKNIDVNVPADEINPAMKIFDGIPDSNGHINWVNPKPIENKLRTYDITTLDFYPPNYIPLLKALRKDHANKIYTDSLYYSFSGFIYPEKERLPQDTIVKAITRQAEKQPIQISEAIDTSKNRLEVAVDTSKKLLSDIIDSTKHDRYIHYEIDPSRIRAIWNKKFNNTILATKEFEERLRFIHSLCDPKYLAMYVEGMNYPMYQIDQACANEAGNVAIRKKFLEFASRKDGGVMLKEGMQDKLSEYFQKKYTAYKQAAEKTRAKYEAELTRLNQIADNKRREQATRDYIREDKNFEEEFCINLTDAYRQIGVKRTCNDTIIPPPPPAKYYNVTITTVGWKNLDVYVFDATTNRQSRTYTDPVSGKTATLTYKEVNISIENIAQYDKVLVYLIPDSLSSFQRLEQQGDVFKESMNLLFKYNAVAIGYKGTQIFVYRQPGLQPGSHVFKMSLTTEKELRDLLKTYSNQKSKELKTELEYQLFEQQEIVRQVQLRKEEEFREKVASAIFNCGEVGYGLPEKARVYSK